MRTLTGARSSSLLVCALLLLAPWLVAAHGPTGSDQGATSATVGGVLVPGVASVAELEIPHESRGLIAELEWGDDAMGWCRFVPGVWPNDPAMALHVGSERIVAERITRDEHGNATAHADVSDRLPGILAADGRTVVVRGVAPGAGDPCWGKWRLRVSWHAALEVRTSAEPSAANPGERITQHAVITNTGGVPLTRIEAELGTGPCRRDVDRLEPGRSAEVSCEGAVPEDGVLTARVRGTTPDGSRVTAEATGRVEILQQAQIELTIGDIALAEGADAALVPVTVRNPSTVPLVDVVVTGRPAACGREIGELAPGRAITYTCRVGAGERVDLTVTATAVSGGAVADSAQLVRATARAVAPVAPTLPGVDTAVVPPPSVPELAESSGVREAPARAAGIIAVLGVLVMTVSVGALSSATRIGR
ncbi:hypothetical protein SAMN02982929_02397 [Saccharopolyspora kobensis]|uniref:DUF11 domain-containing protein n=1 Tax=Saccharopolyspora kobensis TaxID=146035 RepID=A0A1H6AMY1_9PSEU|nr:hypothetical protein [Saccharopolyspora kobensis]SEG49762.1 hypothetical protein SAMN02982929_02397 [Saccharopolyspora kobensis]SFE75107.1 hypothetical protein SAMN05216506_1145 [Saccharopolyspora kobensis]